MDVIRIPKILLPRADFETWAVIACDQFTSNAAYWRETERLTKGKLSSYHLILPEIYLKDNLQSRIDLACKNMYSYLQGGAFKEVEGGFVLVRRNTSSGVRTGIVLSVDLEDYSFKKGAQTPVRSTEATISGRIPPRVRIRKDAPIELPHIMLLYDDPSFSVLDSVEEGDTLYDFNLMQGGGRIKGSYVKNAQRVTESFYALVKDSPDKFLFAVGDGNHSLAAAKTCWEDIKPTLPPEERLTHPARFALAEAVNIYDKALNFEPIHRFVKGVDPLDLIAHMPRQGSGMAYVAYGGKAQGFPFPQDIPQGIKMLDGYIEGYTAEHGGEIDYIHGRGELLELTASGGVGFILPPIQKSDFFGSISRGGNLPKKTFSMGQGRDKRYYIEAKAIK